MSNSIKIKKLKNKKVVDNIFKSGKQIKSGPIILYFLSNIEEKNIFIGVSASKKKNPLAVNRNKAKRQLRAIISSNLDMIKKKFPSGFYFFVCNDFFNFSSRDLDFCFSKFFDSI